MWILFILIPVSLILGGMGLMAFYWALKSDQFSDLEGNSVRILIDREPDEDKPKPTADPAKTHIDKDA